MSARMLVVTADAFRVPTTAQAKRERALFRSLAHETDTLYDVDPAWAREWLLELIARAASAGTAVLFIGDQPDDHTNTDFVSAFGVDVEPCLSFSSVPTASPETKRPKTSGARLKERVDAFNGYRLDDVFNAPLMTVVIDRAFSDPRARQYFRRHERITGGVLTLIEPSQWSGLCLADYATACSSLRIAPPAPQPVEAPRNESQKYDQDPNTPF